MSKTAPGPKELAHRAMREAKYERAEAKAKPAKAPKAPKKKPDATTA